MFFKKPLAGSENEFIKNLQYLVGKDSSKPVSFFPPNVIQIKTKDMDFPITFMSGKSIISEEMMDLIKPSWQ